jgi:large subunit ribosomal protein L18
MANKANYRVPVRRRRQGKTDYQARKAMVISGRPRLVARPSTKNVQAQIIVAKPIGDMTLVAASSRELAKKYGWKAATGSVPAAYLTGLLCGLKAKQAGINAAILDIGMVIPTKGARVFAVLHGVIDAGVEVPHGEGKIVAGRHKGNHIAAYAQELGADSDEYKAKFSKFLAAGITPEKIVEHYTAVKAAIVGSFKGVVVAPEPADEKPAKKAPKAAPPKEKAAPKAEAKAAPAPKADAKVEEAKAVPAKEHAPVKAEKAPKAEKAEKAPAKETAPAKKEQAPKAEKAVKEKAPAAKEAKAKKAPVKEKESKEEKAPAKKASKKGENKE